MTLTKSPPHPTTLIGRYDLGRKVGDGSCGVVYQARDRQTGGTVAVKLLNVNLAKNPDLHRRFALEFRAATKLEHPNIVRALDFGMEGGTSYLVTEYVAGPNLGELIDQRVRLPEDESVRIITQVAQALHYAHTGKIIHRDVKPDNILVRPDGLAKLADFGLAKDHNDDQGLTRPARGLGTPHYMAPEQYQDAKNVSVRCDVYSLGATLYNAVTGRLPFDEAASLAALVKKIKGELPSARELVPDLSPAVDEAIRRAMDPDPTRRPASCLEFLHLLTPPGASPSPSPSGVIPGPAERRAAVRYPLTLGANCVIETGIHGAADVSREAWPLVMKDVSVGGVGLLLARRFEPGTRLAVELRGGPTVRSFPVKVVRVGADTLGHWSHGCVFDKPLTEDELAALLREVTRPG